MQSSGAVRHRRGFPTAVALSCGLLFAACSSGGQARTDDIEDPSGRDGGGGPGRDGGAPLDLAEGRPGAPSRAMPLWADTVRSEADLPALGHVELGYAAGGTLTMTTSNNTDPIVLSKGKPEQRELTGRFQTVLAHYAPTGQLMRARWIAEHWTTAQPGFTQNQVHTAVLPSGAVQLVGQFAGAARFGAGDPGERQLQTQRLVRGGTIYVVADPFVASFDAQGKIEWVGRGEQKVGISGPSAYPSGIVTHQDGSMTSVGAFDDTMDFYGGDFSRLSIPHGKAYSPAMFITRHQKAGRIEWARRVLDLWPRGIAGRPDGSFVVVGQAYAGTTFGEGEPAETTLPTPPKDTYLNFVASYGPDGKLRWARGIHGALGISAALVGVLPSGGFLVVVNGTGTVSFPATPGAPAPIAVDPEYDVLLLRYDEDGTLRWAKTLGGPGYQTATALLAKSGGFYLALSIGDQGAVLTTTKGVRIAPPAPATGGTLLLSVAEDGSLSDVHALGDGITTVGLAVSPTGEVAAGGMFGTTEPMSEGAILGVGSGNPISLSPAPSGKRNVFVAAFKL